MGSAITQRLSIMNYTWQLRVFLKKHSTMHTKAIECLTKKQKLANTNILAICDFSQSSSKKRFYILDLATNKVLLTTYVAHGRGSGAEYPMRFSNKARSHQSSLGFYITGSTLLWRTRSFIKITRSRTRV